MDDHLRNPNSSILAQISWVYTGDLDATTRFYADVLGLDCIREAGGARIFATAEHAGIGVCQAFADRVIEPRGGMISIVTDDVDAWYRHLLGKGVEIAQPPRRLEQFAIYSFFVTDPNGYHIEFQQFDVGA